MNSLRHTRETLSAADVLEGRLQSSRISSLENPFIKLALIVSIFLLGWWTMGKPLSGIGPERYVDNFQFWLAAIIPFWSLVTLDFRPRRRSRTVFRLVVSFAWLTLLQTLVPREWWLVLVNRWIAYTSSDWWVERTGFLIEQLGWQSWFWTKLLRCGAALDFTLEPLQVATIISFFLAAYVTGIFSSRDALFLGSPLLLVARTPLIGRAFGLFYGIYIIIVFVYFFLAQMLGPRAGMVMGMLATRWRLEKRRDRKGRLRRILKVGIVLFATQAAEVVTAAYSVMSERRVLEERAKDPIARTWSGADIAVVVGLTILIANWLGWAS